MYLQKHVHLGKHVYLQKHEHIRNICTYRNMCTYNTGKNTQHFTINIKGQLSTIMFLKNMMCLHGKEAVASEDGLFWVCGQSKSCNLNCWGEDAHLYEVGIDKFLCLNQCQPICCETNLASLKIVKNPEKASYGRPFFVCPKDVQCGYFAWADERIHEKPMCRCGKKCVMFAVKKECPNKGRSFFCCPEKREKSCRFFVWTNEPLGKEPLTRPSTLPTKGEIKARTTSFIEFKGGKSSFGQLGEVYKEKYLEKRKKRPRLFKTRSSDDSDIESSQAKPQTLGWYPGGYQGAKPLRWSKKRKTAADYFKSDTEDEDENGQRQIDD